MHATSSPNFQYVVEGQVYLQGEIDEKPVC